MHTNLEAFFSRDVTDVAKALLGATVTVGGTGGIITETEAYHPEEPASHAHRGETPRNRAMFLGPAHVYVYRSYGLHWCLNFVCAGNAAVLVRALEPTEGLGTMRERRGVEDHRLLCSGPGKLCEALGVTGTLDGVKLPNPAIGLELPGSTVDIVAGPRIGISKATELRWRFGIAGSRYLSRGFPRE
jgi:DNA-3-methyladenine glycosylase